MINPATVFAATWVDGLFVFTGKTRRHELDGQVVTGLVESRKGGVLAIVDGHSLCQRNSQGLWSTIATTDSNLSCLVAVDDAIYVGTDDARVLRMRERGSVEELPGFDSVQGRGMWYAGSAVIDGQRLGPPLGVRSMAATSDGSVLLANVHVGGTPRSIDGGVTWQPTIAIDSDVHEVCAHPVQPNIVVAAAAIGLCISRDGGATWTVEQEGLHAFYCSAVALSESDILIAASTDHFATEGAVYRRRIEGNDPLEPVRGLPRWLKGIVDTGCIATHGSVIAIADKAGNLYLSEDGGNSWRTESGLPTLSKLIVVGTES